MDINDFRIQVTKAGSHPHKLPKCNGTREAWKQVRKDKWTALKGIPCSSSLYSSIVNLVNQMLIDSVVEGHNVVFPYGMGSMYLIEEPVVIRKDGKNNCLVDWKKTLEWWHKDPLAHKQKRVLKTPASSVVKMKFRKGDFKDCKYWAFRFNRGLKRMVTKLSGKMKLNTLKV